MAAPAEAPKAVENGQCSDRGFRWPVILIPILQHGGAEDFKRDIAEMQEGETLRAVSGAADWHIFNEVGVDLEKAHKEKGITIKLIVGPALSVSPQGDNALIDLAKQGDVELYRGIRRPRPHHYRIFGGRKRWCESHHQPLEPLNQRRVAYFGSEHIPFDAGAFESEIMALKLKASRQPKRDFVLLTDEAQTELLEMARKRSIDSDWLKKEEIKGLLSIGGKFRELTPERMRLIQLPRIR